MQESGAIKTWQRTAIQAQPLGDGAPIACEQAVNWLGEEAQQGKGKNLAQGAPYAGQASHGLKNRPSPTEAPAVLAYRIEGLARHLRGQASGDACQVCLLESDDSSFPAESRPAAQSFKAIQTPPSPSKMTVSRDIVGHQKPKAESRKFAIPPEPSHRIGCRELCGTLEASLRAGPTAGQA